MEENRFFYIIAILALLSLTLRLWGIAEVREYVGDERLDVPAAINYVEHGNAGNDTWSYPPLSHILIYATISIFGNNPYGWRLKNIVLGSASVILLFLIGMKIYNDIKISLLASLLLSMDPLHIAYSRSTISEIAVLCFFLLFFYLILRYLNEKKDHLISAGFSLGLVMSSKGYYAIASTIIIAYVLIRSFREGGRGAEFIDIISKLVFLPCIVYLLTYIPWFASGHDFMEFIQMKLDSYSVVRARAFLNEAVLSEGGMPWEWFVRPRGYGWEIYNDGVFGSFALLLNNPPIWMLTFPALFFTIRKTVKKVDTGPFLTLTIFLSTYLFLLILMLRRPIFSYSAVPVVPFAYLFIACFTVAVLHKFKNSALLYKIVIIMISAWGLYLYPLATGKTVPVALYKPVLMTTKINSLNN